jgi:antitoxin VapB
MSVKSVKNDIKNTGLVFLNNQTQAVRMPKKARFPDDVKSVYVRVVGNERILCPVENTWDSFFNSTEAVTEDFMEHLQLPIRLGGDS